MPSVRVRHAAGNEIRESIYEDAGIRYDSWKGHQIVIERIIEGSGAFTVAVLNHVYSAEVIE